MKNDRMERLLAESEDLVNEVERHYGPAGTRGDRDIDIDARKEAYRRFRATGADSGAIPLDGYVDISVSDDGMRVEADIHPPTEGMRPVETKEVYDMLENEGVTYGIDHARIESVVLQCNLEHEDILQEVIATGRPPVPEIPAHLIPDDQLFEKPAPVDDDDPRRIDYKETRSYIQVRAGDRVAQLVPKQEGTPGLTVWNREVPFSREKVPPFKPGTGTKIEDDRLLAAIDGTLEIKRNVITVSETLLLTTDVDYRTGHVEFTGNIIVRGQVREGFRIRSERSIFFEDTVDVSDIEATRDIVVKRGLIGRKEGRLKAGGSLQARFIENCYVEATEGISVFAAIVQSHIFTCGAITLGPHGVVVGGKLYAQQGLVTSQIGTDAGPKTEIICGIDYTISQKLEWIRDQSMRLATKLTDVRRIRERSGGSPAPQLAKLEIKLKTALRRMNQSATTLIPDLDKNEEATVTVRGNVYPGTYIEICHVSCIVHRRARNVCFRLDKSEGRIRMDGV